MKNEPDLTVGYLGSRPLPNVGSGIIIPVRGVNFVNFLITADIKRRYHYTGAWRQLRQFLNASRHCRADPDNAEFGGGLAGDEQEGGNVAFLA